MPPPSHAPQGRGSSAGASHDGFDGFGAGVAPGGLKRTRVDGDAGRAELKHENEAPGATPPLVADGLADVLLSRDLSRIRAFCDSTVPGMLPPRGSELLALESMRAPLSLEHVQKMMHCLCTW